jgi:hypothetical protein
VKFASLQRALTGESFATVAESFGLKNKEELAQMRLWVAVNAMNCEKEDDRIDKELGQARTDMPNNADATLRQMKDLVEKLLRADFETRIAMKRRAEDELRIERLVDEALVSETEEAFVEQINEGLDFRDRSSTGYAPLMGKLMNSKIPVTLRFRKLAIMITGRFTGSLEREKMICWNGGNVARQSLDDLRVLFAAHNKLNLFERVSVVVAENTKHNYLRSLTNRHSHGVAKPSYFALGFDSLFELEKACRDCSKGFTSKDWESYIAVHTNCCGFRHGKRK